jgi:hypothetical protein
MIRRDVLGAQNLPDISIFNFPAKSARMGAASSGAIAIISLLSSWNVGERSGYLVGKGLLRNGGIDVPPIFS